MRTLRLLINASFTADHLANFLTHETFWPALECTLLPYNQELRSLAARNSPVWTEEHDFLLLFTLPEKISPAYSQAIAENSDNSAILDDVDTLAHLVLKVAPRFRAIFVASWLPSPVQERPGLLNYRPQIGSSYLLNLMNLRLAEHCESASNVYLLDASRWTRLASSTAFQPKMWYWSKVAFSNQVLQEAALDLKFAVRTLLGQSKKLFVLDLDNTLWGNTLDGADGIRLGGHDVQGEAFADFQRCLLAQKERGALLAICSKNDEEVALRIIDTHPEMILRRSDFASWRINWNDKAANIVSIAEELRLGLDAIVFLDDSPVERDRVRQALPDVAVPDLPQDPSFYPIAFNQMRYFDRPAVTSEDNFRTAAYQAERVRRTSRSGVQSEAEWIRTLQIVVCIEHLNETNLQRANQLLNKTNQMNLTTRRLTESELRKVAQNGRVLTFEVSDRFGRYGLAGIVSVQCQDGIAELADFVASCRVLGRGVENIMLSAAVDLVHACGAESLNASFRDTGRNAVCLQFLKKSGLIFDETGPSFRWIRGATYLSHPDWIQYLTVKNEAVTAAANF